jgi:hypothetical protein
MYKSSTTTQIKTTTINQRILVRKRHNQDHRHRQSQGQGKAVKKILL